MINNEELHCVISDLCSQGRDRDSEIMRIREALKDWQEFSADVQAACPAGKDWLDGLRSRTEALLK